jgi:LmbE family N-acetylglucosaminyl deacetylase
VSFPPSAAPLDHGERVLVVMAHPDGAVYVTHELRRDLTREIRRFQPDRVLTQSPALPEGRLAELFSIVRTS